MANSPETDALRQDLDQLRKDFKALSDSLKHSSRDKAEAGMGKARDRFGRLCKQAEARPGITLLSTLGVGILIGKIISR